MEYDCKAGASPSLKVIPGGHTTFTWTDFGREAYFQQPFKWVDRASSNLGPRKQRSNGTIKASMEHEHLSQMLGHVTKWFSYEGWGGEQTPTRVYTLIAFNSLKNLINEQTVSRVVWLYRQRDLIEIFPENMISSSSHFDNSNIARWWQSQYLDFRS